MKGVSHIIPDHRATAHHRLRIIDESGEEYNG